MRCMVLCSVLAVMAGGCTGGITAPSRQETTVPTAPGTAVPSTRANLQLGYMSVVDAGQSAVSGWQYKVIVNLRETGGVDMTVTNIQMQAAVASRILATASVSPGLSVPANSNKDAGLVFVTDAQVGDLSALGVSVTVQFTDANGNAGSVSGAFSGFGAWDY